MPLTRKVLSCTQKFSRERKRFLQRRIEMALSWAKACGARFGHADHSRRVARPRNETRRDRGSALRIDGGPVRRRRPIGPPVHPSTEHIFKAEVTCPRGHRLTLKGHSISATGHVQPSVICRHPGCDFHEFVMLDN
jgi:hypothetical protein